MENTAIKQEPVDHDLLSPCELLSQLPSSHGNEFDINDILNQCRLTSQSHVSTKVKEEPEVSWSWESPPNAPLHTMKHELWHKDHDAYPTQEYMGVKVEPCGQVGWDHQNTDVIDPIQVTVKQETGTDSMDQLKKEPLLKEKPIKKTNSGESRVSMTQAGGHFPVGLYEVNLDLIVQKRSGGITEVTPRGTQLPCSLCSFKAPNKTDLTEHQKTHAGIRKLPYRCSICKFGAFRSTDLVSHYSIKHSEDWKFKCSFCPYRNTRKHVLLRHESMHSGDKCYSHSQYTDGDETGMSSEHPGNTGQKLANTQYQPRVFVCSYCHYRTNHRGMLNRHERLHTGKYLFKCTTCPFSAVRKQTLLRHVVKHMGANDTPKDQQT